jgi:FtsZ-binding cell division protein ZapB
MGKRFCIQDVLKKQMQQDASAFQQQRESFNAQLKQKETELQNTVESLNRVQVDSEARVNQLSTDLQGAQDRIAALQGQAKAAAEVHEVGNACMNPL